MKKTASGGGAGAFPKGKSLCGRRKPQFFGPCGAILRVISVTMWFFKGARAAEGRAPSKKRGARSAPFFRGAMRFLTEKSCDFPLPRRIFRSLKLFLAYTSFSANCQGRGLGEALAQAQGAGPGGISYLL